MTDRAHSDEDLRRRFRQAIIDSLQMTPVGGETLRFDRDTGRQWFDENQGQPVFTSLKSSLVGSLVQLRRKGATDEALMVEVASLRLALMDAMHASDEPLSVVSESFQLSTWYQSVKSLMDPHGELSDLEFALLQVHLLLQEACYMLELPGFLDPPWSLRSVGTPVVPMTVEQRLAKVEASNRRFMTGTLLGVLAAIGLVVVAFATADHWRKVDVPKRAETFRNAAVETGKFRVTDDGRSPCAVGQSWTGCIADMTKELDEACWVNRGPDDYTYEHSSLAALSELTKRGFKVCEAYEAEIDRMRRDRGEYVATLGGYGRLTRVPVVETKRVSNGDSRPAVTHEAVCYLGFIGECP